MPTPMTRIRQEDHPLPAKFTASPHAPRVTPLQEGAQIQHHVLNVIERGGSIQFSLQTMNSPALGASIRTYASQIAASKTYDATPRYSEKIDEMDGLENLHSLERADNSSSFYKYISEYFTSRLKDTPYDIPLKGGAPRWILLELQNDYNWRFAPGTPGVATEVDNNAQTPPENYGICFVTKDKIHGPDPVSEPYLCVPDRGDPDSPQDWECKVLFWAVPCRSDEKERKFNFYLEFHQHSDGKHRSLPMIFDPNVPNDGGGSIIPP